MKRLAILVVVLFPLAAFAQATAERPGVELTPPGDGPSVIDLAVATGVTDRQPDGVSDSFPASVGKLYCWSAVKNTGEPTQLTHVWRFGDRVVSELPIQVGKSTRWRSWTVQRINDKLTGQWSCDVVNEGGTSLGKSTFTVQ